MPRSKNEIPVISQRAKELFDEKFEHENVTRADLADYCGLRRQRISQILKGSGTCNVGNIAANKLAQYLQCSVDYLSGRTSNRLATAPSYAHVNRNTNTSSTKTEELMPAFDKPDHVTRLQQRIFNLTSFQQSALDTILDLFEQSNSAKECEHVAKICSILLEKDKPQTSQTTQDYIYNDLKYSILPDLTNEILDILYTDKYSQKLVDTPFSDAQFTNFLKQNLGDFKKETLQLFQSKLRRVLSVYRNPESTSGEKALTAKPSLSTNRVVEVTSYILCLCKLKIERYLDEHYSKSSFTKSGSLSETELIRDFQKYLERNSKDYIDSMIKDIEKYFLERQKL